MAYHFLWLQGENDLQTLVVWPPKTAMRRSGRWRFLQLRAVGRMASDEAGDEHDQGARHDVQIVPFDEPDGERLIHETELKSVLGRAEQAPADRFNPDLPLIARFRLAPPFQARVMTFTPGQGFRHLTGNVLFRSEPDADLSVRPVSAPDQTPPLDGDVAPDISAGEDRTTVLAAPVSVLEAPVSAPAADDKPAKPDEPRVYHYSLTGFGYRPQSHYRTTAGARHFTWVASGEQVPLPGHFILADRFFTAIERHSEQSDQSPDLAPDLGEMACVYAVPEYGALARGPARQVYPVDNLTFPVRAALPDLRAGFRTYRDGPKPVRAEITRRLETVRQRLHCPALIIGTGQSREMQRFVYEDVIAFHWRRAAAYRVWQEQFSDHHRDEFYRFIRESGGLGHQGMTANAPRQMRGLVFDQPQIQGYNLRALEFDKRPGMFDIRAIFAGVFHGMRHQIAHGDIVGLMLRSGQNRFAVTAGPALIRDQSLAGDEEAAGADDARAGQHMLADAEADTGRLSFMFLTNDIIPAADILAWPGYARLREMFEHDLEMLRRAVIRDAGADETARLIGLYQSPDVARVKSDPVMNLISHGGEPVLVHGFHQLLEWTKRTETQGLLDNSSALEPQKARSLAYFQESFLSSATFFECPQLARVWLLSPVFRQLTLQADREALLADLDEQPFLQTLFAHTELRDLAAWVVGLDVEAQCLFWVMAGQVSAGFLNLLRRYEVTPDEQLYYELTTHAEGVEKAEEQVIATLSRFARIPRIEWHSTAAVWAREHPISSEKIQQFIRDNQHGRMTAKNRHYRQILELMRLHEEAMSQGDQIKLVEALYEITTPYRPKLVAGERDPKVSDDELLGEIRTLTEKIAEKLPDKTIDPAGFESQVMFPSYRSLLGCVRDKLTLYERYCRRLTGLQESIEQAMALPQGTRKAAEALKAMMEAQIRQKGQDEEQYREWQRRLYARLDRAGYLDQLEALNNALKAAKEKFADGDEELAAVLDECEIEIRQWLPMIAHLNLIANLREIINGFQAGFASEVKRASTAREWKKLKELRVVSDRLTAAAQTFPKTIDSHAGVINEILLAAREFTEIQRG